MKIVYIAESIEGIVEYAHPPVESRVAKEKLAATIEELFIPRKLVISYSITDDIKFPFPFKKPDTESAYSLVLDKFFGDNPGKDGISFELNELFDQPKREFAVFEKNLIRELDEATDEHILEMFERFHYTEEGTKKRYSNALSELKKLWKPYAEIEQYFNYEYDATRSNMLSALSTVDNCHIRGLLKGIDETRKLLSTGARDKAKENVMFNYSDWRRNNLARLYNYCGDAKFYGAGFWMARMVAPDSEIGDSENKNLPRTVEKALDNMDKPYQVIKF